MRWNLKRLFVAVAALTVLWTPMTQAQETETSQVYTQKLRWKNGDILPGKLLESTSGAIHWASPHFSDDLVIDIGVLDSIIFPEQSVPATEAFRVGTVSGDIWMADIIDSDDDTFLFSSKRHGLFRVNRAAIYTLERRVHPNLVFDGSQLTNWKLPKEDAKKPVLLFGGDARSDWYADRSGHPRTDKVKAKIFHALDWPQYFEIDLELASAARPPGFVFALGKNLYEALRLETWVNELVVVQGTLFEPVLTIEPDRRSFRLRLAYDGDTDVLEVFDFAGNLLLKLDGVEQTVEESGVYIFNRGQNLTVRRLRVYQQSIGAAKQQIDSSKPRIHMMNGQVFYGKLFVKKESTYVVDDSSKNGEGIRRDIDIQQIDRVVQSGTALAEIDHSVGLAYPDGAILRGKVAQVNSDGVGLQTAFADEPVNCAFAGASVLRVEPKGAKAHEQVENEDRLFHPSGSLRGRASFGGKEGSLIRWQPVGASEAVRLANTRAAYIERNNRRASKTWPIDTSRFRHVLHLRNGEILPCQISSYSEATIGFRSPFISAQRIDSASVKALEFSGRTHATYFNRRRVTSGKGSYTVLARGVGELQVANRIVIQNVGGEGELNLEKIFAEGGNINLENGEIKIIVDGKEIDVRPGQDWTELMHNQGGSHKLDVKLERALTVPRFSRDNPPSHILVAENGDMKRGKLLGFNGQTIQFDSKLRQFSVPIERVARVVNVSVDNDQQPEVSSQKEQNSVTLTVPDSQRSPTAIQSEISVRLTDGSILVFEPLEVRDGTLLGRSSIYGEVVLPVDSIQHLYFGDTTGSFKAAFEEWVVRPAKEPTFGDSP
ncbi:MAG: hypothetical protein OYL97_08995 [Candidatus Poribacteria bacterium]|nr:hypothetical protein [Candidatus Poribacteria bacterium]